MQYKRSIILINRKFQLKFAFMVCSLIFILSMVYPIVIYNMFESLLQMVKQPATVPALTEESIRTIQNKVLVVLGVVQFAFLAITFLLSIFLSHRIAGPLFKLRKSMDEVSKGNLDQRIAFRKTDHFLELQDSFNDMIQHLSVRRWR